MPKIIFTAHNGEVRTIEVEPGITLMEAARNNGIAGIVAECGGMCACATCHVYVASEWFDLCGAPGENEEPLLDFIDDRKANSRLACQINLTEGLDGLKVETPESQD